MLYTCKFLILERNLLGFKGVYYLGLNIIEHSDCLKIKQWGQP
jgi:hypothetical protein